ncbi:MAG: response regulator [Hyphomicrobiales bacterium]|nr:response regulator [Hyphomicrobiales bacterium]
MAPIWQSLLANLALVSILLVAWDLLSDLAGRLPKRMQALLLGVLMGCGALISMATARPILPGFIFDLRSAFVAASAFFGGLPAVIVAAAGAILYRLYVGGQGAAAGVAGICVAAAIGLVCHGIVRARRRTIVDIFGLGTAVALGGLVSFLAFPAELRLELMQRTAAPLLLVTFISTIVIGVLIDRQLRRRELSATNMIYNAMVRELPDCLNIKDLDGRFVVANPATAALMCAGQAENLIGKTDFDFYPKELAEQFRQDELRTMASGETLRIDQPALFPDGRQGWLSTLKAPFRDDSGQVAGIITYNRDVTEQKHSAELKNEFISTVSHELRTPLTSIRGSLGLIVGGIAGPLPPKATNLVKIAHANSERLVLLINDILDMEKIESGKMAFELKHMPIRLVLEQIVSASANYMAEKQVGIVLVDDAPRAEANIDPDRLHQAVTNLLSNAIKFSQEGGTIVVRAQYRDGKVLRISVIDQGKGIPEAFRNRIFGKFEQADASSTREKGGTGLGLSIAKSIVERLCGTISFESEEGNGTSFHIDLPEVGKREAKVIDGTDTAGAADRRMRVLIVEDEPDISTVIAALLDAEGFSSDVAPDIAAAKTLLKTRDYKALTLDIRLADESGIKLFRDIRDAQRNRDMPVIVISAVADEAKRSLNGSAVGIIDWLEKPVDPARLHAALGKILDTRIDRRPRILHVEDDEGVLAVMAEGLGSDVSITSAKTVNEARNEISGRYFDLVILDIALPDGSGLELLSDMPVETPVIVFSAAEFEQKLGDRVKAVMTKTKASELDVARIVASFLPVVSSNGP